MALKPCRECKEMVSTSAASCPKCGVPRPTLGGASAARVFLFAVLGVVGTLFLLGITSSKDPAANEAAATTQSAAFSETPKASTGETAAAAECLREAKKLAGHLGGGVGRQTSSVVFLGNVPSPEASYGCPFGPEGARDVFVSWTGQARPPAAIRDLIAKAGEFLTGATRSELNTETAACVAAALKPDSGEMADREFRGVKIECQAFSRDGGGGSVTVYRPAGGYPDRPKLTPEQVAAVERSSEIMATLVRKSEADSQAFVDWWQDTSVPQSVKVFAMLSARMMTLAERCPTAKPVRAKIAEMAGKAGVAPSDIAPGGRYYSLMAMSLASMRSGVAQESVRSACEAARKYE